MTQLVREAPAVFSPAPADRRTGVVAGPVVVAIAFWLLLVLGDVAVLESVLLTAVVAVQALTGGLLWRLARGPVAASVPELLGAGLALGTLLSLLGAQLLRPTPLGPVGWLLPTAVALTALAVPAVRARLRTGTTPPLTSDEVAGVGGGLAVALVFVWAFWRAHPLDWTGWWAYYVDMPYHEALSTSLATWGPGDSIFAAGESVRYHWFVHAWTGATTGAASAERFVVLLRVLPLVVVLGTVCLVWTWGRRLSGSRLVPPLAVLLTVVAMNVGSAKPLNVMQLFTISPSLGIGLLWLLGAALVLTEYLRDRVRWGPALLALFAVGCVGGKTSNAAALAGGLGLLALASLWQPQVRRRVWAALAVVAVATLAAFVALILGSTGDLTVEAGALARTFGLLPGESWLSIGIGTTAVALVFTAKWTGVAVLVAGRGTVLQPEVWLALGAAASGLFLMAVLGHPGASELYFPVSAGVLVAVVSAWGLAEARAHLSSGELGATVLAGAVAAVAGLMVLPPRLTWAAPYLAWALPLLLAGGFLLRARLRRPGRPLSGSLAQAVAVVAVGLVSAAVMTGQVAVVDTLRTAPPAAPAADAPLAFTQSHEDALVWLRDHSAVDDIVATNRQCSHVLPAAEPCPQFRWFLPAAVSERRMFVAGPDYIAGVPHPAWVDERMELSRRFVDEPGAADARALWDAGVRWVVVDVASTPTRAWAPHGEQVFGNDTTVVLRLVEP